MSGVVGVNGVRLSVRSLGDSARRALVVVHGGPTWDHSYLLPAVGELADCAHVVLFDLRGCGRSQRGLPGDQPQPELLADDVAALIDEVGPGLADVLGFSFGGRIAMRLVQRHPGSVRRLVLASTTAYTDYDVTAAPGYRERAALCPAVEWDDDPMLSRTMERDLGFPVAVARRLHAELPGSTLAEIADAGHMAHFDRPGPWVAAVRGFLRAAA